jgi:hypothetical protein
LSFVSTRGETTERKSDSSTRATIVPDGPRFHRRMVRRNAVRASLLAPVILGLVAALLLVGSDSAWRGIPGFVLAIMALPTLPLTGIPVMGGALRWLVAIGTSAVVWASLGVIAARRSTSRVVTGWPEWRREWLRLAAGVWIGALVGIGVAATFLSVNL